MRVEESLVSLSKVPLVSSLLQDHEAVTSVEIPPSEDPLTASLFLSVPDRRGEGMSNLQLSRHSFSFDRVFGPEAHQEAVYEEISELVQSALDGHKARRAEYYLQTCLSSN